MVPGIDQGVINGIDSANISLFSNIIAKIQNFLFIVQSGWEGFKINLLFFLKQDIMQKEKPKILCKCNSL